ncbi:MAG: DNA-binding domain-containing protein [Sphingomicrobium sp.]
MSLATLQRDLRELIAANDMADRSDESARADAGLAVYRNNYRGQLIACLEETFPRTLARLGDTAFRDAADAHIAVIRPSNWSLDAYPRQFPATLEQIYPNDAEIAELAWLESDLECAFVAADADPILPKRLLAVDWDHAIIRFSPSLTVRPVTTNAPAIFSALSAGKVPPAVEAQPKQAAIIVWRQDYVSCFRLVDSHEADALRALGQGTAFADVCAVLVAELGEGGGTQRAGEMLGQWISERLVIDVARECSS